ncbi:neprosin family prolyl endopeptidase [Streptantibioticus parmotrematis]|uniref:neprosin family prolyl endopeptidase n=1 Tax=Streptantibioticus parmotrematis TaxID=2873249 RepID=UPI0033F99D07
MRIRTRLTVGLTAAAAALTLLTGQSAQAAPRPLPSAPPATGAAATGTDNPTCWYGACYDYVYGRQITDATGASVRMEIADPVVNPAQQDEHSLQELALQNTGATSTVEVGWTVDRQVNNGDGRPHLFVYHWVDGQESCYNGCGFVQVSHTVTPGMPLPAGHAGSFAIRELGGDWWIFYDGHAVGYFPGSLWNGTYTSAQKITAFGEVAADASDVPSCTQMGNGRPGTSWGSSWIAGFRLYGSADRPDLTVQTTSPDYYDAGSVTRTSFHLGGPGKGSCGS